jgi:predicted dehydrogenase
VRIGFIGAGAIAHSHIQALEFLGAKVVGATTRGESGKYFAEKYPGVQYYNRPEEMIMDCKPDALFILTHPSAYREILRTIQPFRLPVFLEKPLALSCHEAKELLPLLPKVSFVGLNRRFYSNIQQILPLLKNQSSFIAQLTLPERVKDYKSLSNSDRNNWPMLNSIHCIDLMNFLVGYPSAIIAKSSWGKLEYSSVAQFNVALYETDKGARVSFLSNYDSPGGWRIHIFLTGKEIAIYPLEKTRVISLNGVEEIVPMKEDIDCKPGFVAQARTFIEGVKNPDKVPEGWVSFESALRSMKAVEDLFETQ